ncbi:PREDICTED: SUMO-activating enzyme subunit 1 [Rhagoletis zephyria]|uniref:SUMO-activating enzyme subunit 1 n=1 Tax=Rhagoletis zephyria TaxID=28612 RepID=UPI00081143AB|nr:PREDICTED: SUMO-activating enzyme subunit 1 [Rhagoletis zephyria]
MDDQKNDNLNGVELTEAENELYDRQIRLWGLESQKRLRTAKILVSGLCGIGAEVTKNIILSGVHSVILQDEKSVTEEDFCAQFLVPRTAIGQNRAEASIERARALNPMVEISADTGSLASKNIEYFAEFDVVVAIGATNKELLRVDNICREKAIKFFCGDVWGMFGYCFGDLQEHTFVEDVVKHKVVSKPNEKVKTELITAAVQRTLNFPPLSSVLEFDINAPIFQKKLKRTGPALVLMSVLQEFRETCNRDPSYKTRDADIGELKRIRNEITRVSTLSDEYFENVFAQASPSAAVVGGVMSQEIIKVVSKKEAPHCNVFLFDPDTCCGFVETIGLN